MAKLSFSNKSIEKMYDIFSELPFFWEIDAITCRATENSPYRSILINNLNIHADAKVLDMACGTGLNFNLLEKKIGSNGKIVGIDNSGKTLHIARKRIEHRKWTNINLVKSDASLFHEEHEFDASICTFAIDIIRPYKEAIDRMIELTKSKGRIGFIGFNYSQHPLLKIVNSAWKISGAFIGGVEFGRNIVGYLEKNLIKVMFKEVFGGFYYIAVFKKEE